MRWDESLPSRSGRRFLRRIITPRPWTVLPSARFRRMAPCRPHLSRCLSVLKRNTWIQATRSPNGRMLSSRLRTQNPGRERANIIRRSAAQSIRIRAAVTPWSHVRPLGEDIVATQLVLPTGHTLRPADLGAIAASGHQTIRVARKPKVAILPTGTELVPIGSKLKAGDILEYNSLVLGAQIKAMGGEPTRYPITKDDFDSSANAFCKPHKRMTLFCSMLAPPQAQKISLQSC
jgi:hypothetical protein